MFNIDLQSTTEPILIVPFISICQKVTAYTMSCASMTNCLQCRVHYSRRTQRRSRPICQIYFNIKAECMIADCVHVSHADVQQLMCSRKSIVRQLIHSGHFHSASSNPLLLRGAPETARKLCRN